MDGDYLWGGGREGRGKGVGVGPYSGYVIRGSTYIEDAWFSLRDAQVSLRQQFLHEVLTDESQAKLSLYWFLRINAWDP